MKKQLIPTTLVCLAMATISWGMGTGLVLNGDFEAGNEDFTTSYTYVAPPYDPSVSLWPEGTYTIDTDPHNSHDNFWSFGDHTTGFGNMLVANGHPDPDKRVWEQTIPVLPNADYALTYYLSSCVPGEPAKIQCSVNGVPLGSVSAPATPATWVEVSYFWNSGTSFLATIALEDLNVVRTGNDFAIDDISLFRRVLVDIKPGSFPNAINLGQQGVIPVAILSTENFDAMCIDPASVSLGGFGVQVRGGAGRLMAHAEDVNGDDLLDLVVQIDTTNLVSGDWTDGPIKIVGKTYTECGGEYVVGWDLIVVVPEYRIGTILGEAWLDIEGVEVSDLTSHPDYPDNPSLTVELESFEAPIDWGDNYGTRIHGYLHPQTSGDYIFWIASDDHSELWLSPDSNPAHAVMIANVPGYTPPRDFDNTGGGNGDAEAQESDPIALRAGQRYYIMALQKEGTGGDNVAVAWQGPDCPIRDVIDGDFLSPAH